MLNILLNQVEAIQQAKANVSIVKGLIAAVLTAVVLIITLILATAGTAESYPDGAGAYIVAQVVLAVVVLLVTIIAVLVMGFVLGKVVQLLGGTGNLSEGTIAVSYSALIASVGILVAVVVGMIGAVVTSAIQSVFDLMTGMVVGMVLGAIFGGIVMVTLVVALAVSAATFFRATKELFNVDYILVLVAITAIQLSVAVVITYLTMMSIVAAASALPMGGLL